MNLIIAAGVRTATRAGGRFPAWLLLVMLLLGPDQVMAAPTPPSGGAAGSDPADYHCRIEVLQDLILVELLIPGGDQDGLDLELSAWAGRQDYARSIRHLRAYDTAGNMLDVDFDGKRTWHVASGKRPVRLTYEVHPTKATFAGESPWDHLYPTILETYGLAWGPTFLVLPAAEALRDHEALLYVTAPDHHDRIFSSIGERKVRLGEMMYLFIAWGAYHHHALPVGGRTIELIIEEGDWKIGQAELADLVSKVIEGHAGSMQTIPFDHDLLISLNRGSSSALGGTVVPGAVSLYFDPSMALTDHHHLPAYLVAHELFHLWNGIYLRTSREHEFGYMLWFMEGFTDHYAYLTLFRAGIMGHDDYVAWFNRTVSAYRQNPLALTTSVENGGDLFFTSVEFRNLVYHKGALMASLMDRQIRMHTGHEKALDDLMVSLFNDAKILEQGLTHGRLLVALERLTGAGWDGFFEHYVSGTEPLPIEELEPAADRLPGPTPPGYPPGPGQSDPSP